MDDNPRRSVQPIAVRLAGLLMLVVILGACQPVLDVRLKLDNEYIFNEQRIFTGEYHPRMDVPLRFRLGGGVLCKGEFPLRQRTIEYLKGTISCSDGRLGTFKLDPYDQGFPSGGSGELAGVAFTFTLR